MTGSKGQRMEKVRVGFIPLTDCAPLILASHRGYDRKHGIELVLSREASWAAIRDKLLTRRLDAAHALYGLVYGVQMGIGGPKEDMAVLMTLNQNGQAITLSQRLRGIGVRDGQDIARLIHARERRYTFAQTFPTGTHAMWLNYWLASHGVHPYRDINNVVIPPPQMVSNMALGNMDGFCAGEPWNSLAVSEDSGFTAATSQSIWPDHPEKVLACTHSFTQQKPDTAIALTMAILEAARDLETESGMAEAARLLALPECIGMPETMIAERLQGRYRDGLGREWHDPNPIRFYNDGQVSFPWLSDGMWFLTQHVRWGLLVEEPDYLAIAQQVNQTELYRSAAGALGISVPDSELRMSILMDGQTWDGSNPSAYARSFPLDSGIDRTVITNTLPASHHG